MPINKGFQISTTRRHKTQLRHSSCELHGVKSARNEGSLRVDHVANNRRGHSEKDLLESSLAHTVEVEYCMADSTGNTDAIERLRTQIVRCDCDLNKAPRWGERLQT